MYLFAAPTHCPQETGGKQDFPAGFQLWERLRLHKQPESNATSLGSSRQQRCQAPLPRKKGKSRAWELKMLPRGQENRQCGNLLQLTVRKRISWTAARHRRLMTVQQGEYSDGLHAAPRANPSVQEHVCSSTHSPVVW